MAVPDAELLACNGLDATTGGYLVPPLEPARMAALARGETFEPGALAEATSRAGTEATFGVRYGVDPLDLSQAGWGLILAADADPAIRKALDPLLDHRRATAESKAGRFRVFDGKDGYQPGESKNAFLARNRMGPGPADPDRVPYYLLVAGDPASIPFDFTALLDVTYAVGRIAFPDAEGYARYARSVVEAETGGAAPTRRAAFFGVRNEGDGATASSATHLVPPLATGIAGERPAWTVDAILEGDATKARLLDLLDGPQVPALLFTASHGIGYPFGHPRQLTDQGALVCSDWPGPQARGPISPDTYLAAADVTDAAHVGGMIAFHFACFGAGTPAEDEFTHIATGARGRAPIAPRPFVAALPQRLLAHPGGGALAVIGHVERAWGSSFLWDGAGPQTEVFRSTLLALMDGQPVGHAVDAFNVRYGELAAMLSGELELLKVGKRVDDRALASLWTAANDARGFAVIGDPAVRLAI